MTVAAGTGAARVLRAAGTALPAGPRLGRGRRRDRAAGPSGRLDGAHGARRPGAGRGRLAPPGGGRGAAAGAVAHLRPPPDDGALRRLRRPHRMRRARLAGAPLDTRSRRGAGRAGDAGRPGADRLRRRVRPQPEQPAALRAHRHRRRRHRGRGDPPAARRARRRRRHRLDLSGPDRPAHAARGGGRAHGGGRGSSRSRAPRRLPAARTRRSR